MGIQNRVYSHHSRYQALNLITPQKDYLIHYVILIPKKLLDSAVLVVIQRLDLGNIQGLISYIINLQKDLYLFQG